MEKFAILLLILVSGSACLFGKKDQTSANEQPLKYIAFSADTEAYYTPKWFKNYQGIYTEDMIKVCRKYDIPFTWLMMVERRRLEVQNMAEKHYPERKDIDEFSIHTHFTFIKDHKDDKESYKIIERRIEFMSGAKSELIRLGLPMPKSVRYGYDASRVKYYPIEDFIYFTDSLTVENFFVHPEVIPTIIGIENYRNTGNNVWEFNGGRKLTLLQTCSSFEKEKKQLFEDIDSRLATSDYANISCHDYRKNVPGHMKKVVNYLNKNYDVKYVTVHEIGELIRQGKIENNEF